MQHNHIDIYNGTGRILGTSIFSPQSGTIPVEYEDGESDLLPNQFIIMQLVLRLQSCHFII